MKHSSPKLRIASRSSGLVSMWWSPFPAEGTEVSAAYRKAHQQRFGYSLHQKKADVGEGEGGWLPSLRAVLVALLAGDEY